MQRFLITITLMSLLAMSGCRAASYFSQGKEHFELGQYEDAIADYNEAIRRRPAMTAWPPQLKKRSKRSEPHDRAQLGQPRHDSGARPKLENP